jgi:hypothetical protein
MVNITTGKERTMKIFISGGYHENPLHRLYLGAGMRLLKQDLGLPKFIAVEANRALFRTVILEQRKQFVELVANDDQISWVSADALQSLAKAIWYEADTHEDVFGYFENILWLDDHRTDFSEALPLCRTAERYIQICRKALDNHEPIGDTNTVLQVVSAHISAEAQRQPIESNRIRMEKFFNNGKARSNPYERDKIWADKISRIDCPESAYGIVVVGENHAIDENRYLTALLRKQGHNCQVRFLAKSGDKTPTSWSI